MCWPPTAAHGSLSLHLYVSCGGVVFSFVCFVLFQFFILSYFIFISEIRKGYGSRWEGKGREELGGVEGVKNRIRCMKKYLFSTKEKKRNSDENTVRHVYEKWQASRKDKRYIDGYGKENWQRSCHVRFVDETE